MNSYLVPKISSFCVANLRIPWGAIRALHPEGIINLNILDQNLLRPELIRSSLVIGFLKLYCRSLL